MKKLIAYRIGDEAPRIVPATAERAWMSATHLRYAYRCLPLTIANSMGWELLCPMSITAEWNGGAEIEDIRIEPADAPGRERFAQSHFGHGVLTFRIPYLFRTDAGTGLWIRGSPNLPKDGIAPLEGIVETDWLSFTFTMNWKFTRPGRVTFEKDEPFCFLTPVNYHGLDDLEPEIHPIEANAEIAAAFENYASQRKEFNAKLAAGDPETLRTGWQKWYMRGREPSGELGNPAHISKLRVAAPRVFNEGSGSKSTGSAAGQAEGSPEGNERIDPGTRK